MTYFFIKQSLVNATFKIWLQYAPYKTNCDNIEWLLLRMIKALLS